MHEKTLLYSALGVTAIAAIFAVYNAKDTSPNIAITPVSLIETQKGLAGAEVPVRLTASDGTGLKLVALKAEAAVEDPLALTELHLTFENPESRVLEGTFRITLPQGASLSRFAMKIGNVWQEGEVVEKQAARQAYEDALHRRQDPALMEQGAGNEFSARVFPIPAKGTKEIIVTYAEAVEIGAPYILPLRGLPQLGSLDVNVHVSGTKAAEGKTDALFGIHQSKFQPAADFVVAGNKLPRSSGLRNGDLAITRVVPFASSQPEAIGAALVLVDTSASRGLGIGEQARTVRSVLAKLPASGNVTVACFDQEVVPIYTGTASAFGEKEVQAIIDRGALGASDFEGAIAWAATEAPKSKATRIIMVTDGVATAGETDAQKLKTKVEALRGAGVTRMDAVAIGGIRDDGFLRTVVRGVLDHDGVVLDSKIGPEAIARRLGEKTSSGVAVKVDGARWSYPTTLDGLQAGDEVLVYSEIDASRPVKIDVNGQQFAPDLRTIERPLVERAWAQAKIQSLIEQPKESASATKQQIIALSTGHRVLSPFTALLVLETDWDYRRFNIDRNAKLDILTVADGKVAVTESGRSWDEEQKQVLAREEKPKEARAKGGAAPPVPTTTPPSAPAAAAAPAVQPTPEPLASAAAPSPEVAQPDGLGALSGLGQGGSGQGEGTGLGRIGTLGHGAAPGNAPADRGGDVPDQNARSANADSPTSPPAARAPAPRRRPALANGQHCSPDDPLCAEPTPPPPPPPPPPRSQTGERRVEGPVGTVRPTILNVESGIAADEVQRVIRGAVPRFRQCYSASLERNPSMGGTLTMHVVVDKVGEVSSTILDGATGDDAFRSCITSATKGLHFPAPGNAEAHFTQSFDLVGAGSQEINTGNVPQALPYEGRFKTVMEALARGEKDAALTEANRWHGEQPGDELSLVALGEVFEAKNDLHSAARAYGSILELFSFRADSRRFAGERLERLADERAQTLAIDTFGKAVEERPDHPASHRLYAYALAKHGEWEKAFEAIKVGAARNYPAGRFRGVDRILKEDEGLIAAGWMRAAPARAAEIKTKLHAAGGTEETGPSLRFVLVWETDANDVDFHIHDGKGGHAFYSQMQLPSGGELYADVTTGYGPECFTIRGAHDSLAYPYTLQAHYYSRGPMGYGMGKLQIIEHDGKGKLSFDERPFVVMVDRAYVDMGKVDKTTKLIEARAKQSGPGSFSASVVFGR